MFFCDQWCEMMFFYFLIIIFLNCYPNQDHMSNYRLWTVICMLMFSVNQIFFYSCKTGTILVTQFSSHFSLRYFIFLPACPKPQFTLSLLLSMISLCPCFFIQFDETFVFLLFSSLLPFLHTPVHFPKAIPLSASTYFP